MVRARVMVNWQLIGGKMLRGEKLAEIRKVIVSCLFDIFCLFVIHFYYLLVDCHDCFMFICRLLQNNSMDVIDGQFFSQIESDSLCIVF